MPPRSSSVDGGVSILVFAIDCQARGGATAQKILLLTDISYPSHDPAHAGALTLTLWMSPSEAAVHKFAMVSVL